MALSPIISSTRLPEHKIIGSEDLTQGAGSDAVHGTRLEIHEDSTGDIPATGSLVEVDIDALQLEISGAFRAVELAGPVNPVLIADDFPELGSDLVAALASLNVQDFSHCVLL